MRANYTNSKLDMVFLTRVVNMQDKLLLMLGEPGPLSNIGNKYFQNTKNIWQNTALAKQISKNDGMENTDVLYGEQMQKMKFYEQAKQTKLVEAKSATDSD